jgi:phage shock protein C
MTEMPNAPQPYPPVPPAQPYKQLRRSRTDKMLGGVCAGIAKYLDIDPVAARVAFAVFAVITGGLGAVAYLAAWMVMPEEPPSEYPPYPTQPPTAPPTAPPAA